MGPDVADHQRIAVGRGARGRERPHDAAATALIVDDDRLSERLRKLLGDGTGDEVDAATRLHRRDDFDRPARPRTLRMEPARAERDESQRERENAASTGCLTAATVHGGEPPD
jgi:hypothetical protein